MTAWNLPQAAETMLVGFLRAGPGFHCRERKAKLMMHDIAICCGNGAGFIGLGMSKIDHRKNHCLWFGEEACVCTKIGANRDTAAQHALSKGYGADNSSTHCRPSSGPLRQLRQWKHSELDIFSFTFRACGTSCWIQFATTNLPINIGCAICRLLGCQWRCSSTPPPPLRWE